MGLDRSRTGTAAKPITAEDRALAGMRKKWRQHYPHGKWVLLGKILSQVEIFDKLWYIYMLSPRTRLSAEMGVGRPTGCPGAVDPLKILKEEGRTCDPKVVSSSRDRICMKHLLAIRQVGGIANQRAYCSCDVLDTADVRSSHAAF